MKVFCISGKAGAGKDTLGTQIETNLKEHGLNALVIHYADLLKWICSKYFGWDGSKDVKGRSLLQYVGTEQIRSKEPDYWVNFVIDIMKFFPDTWDAVIIPDCRFPNEIEKLREAGFDVVHIRIERPGYNILTEEQMKHPSEVALDNYPVDIRVRNDGTLWDLYHNYAREIVDQFC